MKIFITGATGFLGTTLCKHLRAAGHQLTAPSSKECNLREYSSFEKYTSEKFDQIYHLAAWTQAGDFCLHHPGEQWIINQQMNTNVLRWWHEQQPQAKMIAIGTSCCYEPGTPHTEDRFLVGMPTESLFTYAMVKRMLLVGLQALSKQFGLRYLFVVPSTLYGADYHLDGRQMHFIFDVMRKIVEAKYDGKEVVLWGDGSQVRELVYVDDFVKALFALNEKYENQTFNIGAGKGHTIKEFAQVLCNIIGYDFAKIKYDTTKYVGATEKVLSVEKLKEALPQWELTKLDQGLKVVVDWYLKCTRND